MTIIKCDYCGKEFNRKPSVIKLSKQHFCSSDCFKKYKLDNRTFVVCENCGKEFCKRPYDIKSKQHHFCSRECNTKYQVRKFKKDIEYYINDNGCHICTSHCFNHSGYPLIRNKGKKMIMSRYIYELNYGKIPKGMCVLHSCDNPNCINIEHLRIGTHQENMQDKVIKGRATSVCGCKSGMAKLTEAKVIDIRNSDLSSRKIAKIYGIEKTTILNIRSKKTWKHI